MLPLYLIQFLTFFFLFFFFRNKNVREILDLQAELKKYEASD